MRVQALGMRNIFYFKFKVLLKFATQMDDWAALYFSRNYLIGTLSNIEKSKKY